jgi:hypothetical protein
VSEDVVPDELEGFGGFGQRTVDGVDCAPARQAKHRWGVQYQGSFEAEHDGTARAVRMHALALESSGLPVLLESFTGRFVAPDGSLVGSDAISDAVRAETKSVREAEVANLALRVKHIVPSTAEHLRSCLIPQFVLREPDVGLMLKMVAYALSTTIVYSVWERTSIEQRMAELLSRVAECWVPCEQNKKLLQDHGIERVTVVPHPYRPTDDMAKLTRRKPITQRRFYSIGTWQPRKGFHELIGAFLLAFRPGDDVRLSIKYRNMNWPDYPKPEQSIQHWFADPAVKARGWTYENAAAQLTLFGKHWSPSEILKFHYENNIYVSASRGEAFCLPAFDAKIAGNRMVHVPFGGTADFAAPDDVDVPFSADELVPKSYGWEPGAKWARFSVEHLANALRRAAAPAVFARPAGFERFELERVGRLMRERVIAVLKRETPTLEGLPDD